MRKVQAAISIIPVSLTPKALCLIPQMTIWCCAKPSRAPAEALLPTWTPEIMQASTQHQDAPKSTKARHPSVEDEDSTTDVESIHAAAKEHGGILITTTIDV